MVLAGGIEGDIFFDHHLAVLGGKLFGQIFIRFLFQSSVDFFAHTGNSVGSFQKSFAVYIFPDPLQKQADPLFDFFFVHHKKADSFLFSGCAETAFIL